MRRLSHHRLALLLCIALLTATVGCAQSATVSSPTSATAAEPTAVQEDMLTAVRARGVLRIATDANYPPQSFLKIDGTWEGFDIEVGREIARRLGVRSEFVDVSFDALTAGGWNDRWDVHVGSTTITAARNKVLLFTEPYYYTPAVFAVHATSPLTRIADLGGRKVGVGVATTYLDYLSHTLTLEGGEVVPPPAATARAYESEALAIQDLAQGDGVHLDAVLAALPTIQAAIDHGAPLRVLSPPVYYEALAVDLDRSSARDPEPLAEAISRVIRDMHSDGTLSDLSRRFYGVDISKKS